MTAERGKLVAGQSHMMQIVFDQNLIPDGILYHKLRDFWLIWWSLNKMYYEMYIFMLKGLFSM